MSEQAWLNEAVVDAIEDVARAHFPNEIGGVLLGVSIDARPWVTALSTELPAVSSPSHYQLPAGARHRAVDAARERDERLGYVGEWHSHPGDFGPSQTDRRTMLELAATPESGCEEPLLAIARPQSGRYKLDLRQQRGADLLLLQVIATGGLEPPTPTSITRNVDLDERTD